MNSYNTRRWEAGLSFGDDFDESEAISSPAQYSSPCSSYPELPSSDTDGILFGDLPDLPEDLEGDFEYMEPRSARTRSSPMSLEHKTWLALQWISSIPHFSFSTFIVTMFRTDSPVVTAYSNKFLVEKSHIPVMELWLNGKGDEEPKKVKTTVKEGRAATTDWVISSAATVCAREAGFMTDKASDGPFSKNAAALRVSATAVSVKTVQGFRLADLQEVYDQTLPHLQKILKGVIAKDKKTIKPGSRNPDQGRTLVNSVLLNLRSRRTNYHASMNSLLMWDNRVPKRCVIALNRLGVTASYPFQCRAVLSLGEDSIAQARAGANDPSKIKVFPYDNFNWVKKAHEASALHGSVQHDQVSALLVIAPPVGEGTEGLTAQQIMSVDSLKATEGRRHELPPQKALADILPSLEDHQEFRRNAILHVAQMLAEELSSLSTFGSEIPVFTDPKAIPTHKTEEYYLPTFDQEQGSIRGNMAVLEHYFTKVLQIPKSTFETTMHTVLGDRLTTARDRAAQDQRVVDLSEHRFDHLSSFGMISSLMHYCLNYIQAIGGVFWGTTASSDPLSLANLCDQLPNRNNIQLQKVDYYGWLRFLDVVLRSLALKGSATLLGASSHHELEKQLQSDITTVEALLQHSAAIVDSFMAQSTSRLEATGIKSVPGNTICSNAVQLFYTLMLLREMQSAIKLGHTGRVIRMLKSWLPIFYAAKSYNYANETMELLHNLEHNWPKPMASVNANAMLVNPRGHQGDWKPTDIRVEHLNDRVKEHAHGSNASPSLLEKITPAMGHIQDFTDRLFEELNVEAQNQKHTHVSQHQDVKLLLAYFMKHNVFCFDRDQASSGKFFDLFVEGLRRLSGPTGGHAKHLARHALRLRIRHREDVAATIAQSQELQRHPDAFQELEIAKDASFELREGQLVEDISRSDLRDIVWIGMGYTEGDDEDIDC